MGRFVTTATKVVVGCALLAVMGCTAPSPRESASPPPGSTASAVLDRYLRALVAGDCAAARAAASSTFSADPGELCGDVKVSSFAVREDPATPGPNEVIYSTVLTSDGSSDGTIARGETVWFYRLAQQGGEWRLVSGGSGP